MSSAFFRHPQSTIRNRQSDIFCVLLVLILNWLARSGHLDAIFETGYVVRANQWIICRLPEGMNYTVTLHV
jgi:hypothetical protein